MSRQDIILHHELGHTAEVLKGLHVRVKPVGLFLTPAGAGKRVVRRTQHGDKDLCLAVRARVRVDDRHRRTAVIHKLGSKQLSQTYERSELV